MTIPQTSYLHTYIHIKQGFMYAYFYTKMGDKLKEIFKIRPLQNECIAYRSFTKEYQTMFKRTCVNQLRNLLSVEMKIDQVSLKMPRNEQIPIISEDIKRSKVDALLEQYGVLEESLELL